MSTGHETGTGDRPDGPVGGSPAPAGGPVGHDTTVSLRAVTSTDQSETEAGLSGAEQAAVDALPPGSALLVVQRGSNAGARFLLDGETTTAGRRPDSDIFLDDVTVSRKHAEFVRRGAGFVVRDVGSLNGTYVQRDRIDEAELHDGDEVQIGKFRMVFYPSPRDAGGGAGW
jgi:pSer/pThr/pTyr-binding forkhead associated (FHA) protein